MQHKVLVAIPCISGGEHCHLSIDSVCREADVLIIDNGSTLDVKEVIDYWSTIEGIYVIRNDINLYVNMAWCQALKYFLQSDHETLIIMNSDLIMEPGWSKSLDPSKICIPTDGSHTYDVLVTEGTPGVFIHMNRKMAEIVFLIPDYIKIWFGDLFIFQVLRGLGYETVVKAGLIANHYNGGSQSVNIVPNKEAIIEQDKENWKLFGESDIKERVAKWTNL